MYGAFADTTQEYTAASSKNVSRIKANGCSIPDQDHVNMELSSKFLEMIQEFKTDDDATRQFNHHRSMKEGIADYMLSVEARQREELRENKIQELKLEERNSQRCMKAGVADYMLAAEERRRQDDLAAEERRRQDDLEEKRHDRADRNKLRVIELIKWVLVMGFIITLSWMYTKIKTPLEY